MHTKIKQNSDVFLDLFWLIFRLPKTLVLFLHTTKVPEATREKSAPKQLYWAPNYGVDGRLN